ncbi:MAG TPA: hypothetical protein VIY49_22765 [Bryobacteraceae bacterium]
MASAYRAAGFLALVAFGSAANAQVKKSFPTDDEIKLVLTQTERAVQQYKPLIDQLQLELGDTVKDAVTRDREVVAALETAVKAFRNQPQGFNGPLGFSLFEWLDDAMRNSLLCASNASIEVTSQMLIGNTEKASSLLGLSHACADVSTLIYTVSENAGTLYQRYLGTITDVAEQAVATVQKCEDILKKKK